MKNNTQVRAAAAADVDSIEALTALYVKDQTLLPRSRSDILEHLANFVVAEDRTRLVACGAIRDFGNELYEIRSLAVAPGFQGCGLGRKIVSFMLERLSKRRISCRVFALTTSTDFFIKQGFEQVDKQLFPQKIWSDCLKCPKLKCCDEDAVLIKL